MRNKEQISLFQAIAECFGMDEADVIDNNDNETVTIFDEVFQVVEFKQPQEHDGKSYYWAIFPIQPF